MAEKKVETTGKPVNTPPFDKVEDHTKAEPGSTVKQTQPDVKVAEQEQGFVAFNLDMYSLSDLYANIRDGNYWSAFRIAVDILHSNMNYATRGNTPSQRATARAMVQTPASKVAVVEMKQKLEECCTDLEKQQGNQLKISDKPIPVGASMEKNVGKVDLPGLIALVRMILSLFNH